MHFLFELLYTIYPFLWQFVIGTMSVMALGVELITPTVLEEPPTAITSWQLISVALYSAVLAGLAVLGLLLVLHLLAVIFSRVVRKKSKKDKKKFKLLLPKYWQILAVVTWLFYSVVLYQLFHPRLEYVSSVADKLTERLAFPIFMSEILGIGFLFYILLRAVWLLLWSLVPKLANNVVARSVFGVTVVAALLIPVASIVFLWVEVFIDPLNQHTGVRTWQSYSVIHAAIKNTCLFDPNRENCPSSLEEISYIEPAEYQRMMSEAQYVAYYYDLESNQYTLIVRYSPLAVSVYDQRLVQDYGIDVHEFSVSVLGTDQMKDAPAYLRDQKLDALPEWEY